MSKADIMLKELGDNIKDVNFYRNYDTGDLEVQITFEANGLTEKFVRENNIKELDVCPYWE